MILKKPYAFLIKHFRAIHLAITLLLVFNAVTLIKVVGFFNSYVANNYTTTAVMNLDKTYLPVSIYLLVFLTIALIGIMLVLMLHKKKPSNLYIITFLYYIIIFVGMFYIAGVLKSFEDALLAATVARRIRDILIIVYIPQIAFIVLMALRAVGFNVKKFDFTSDLREMDYSIQDAEEFEVNINLEGYKAQQKFNRIRREFVYYIKENKFIVSIISVILIGIIGYLIYSNTYSNFDNNYRMGDSFTFNHLNISFDDAIITNLDYNGNSLGDNDYYVVVKTRAINTFSEPVTIDYKNIKLQIDGHNINPILNNGSLFVDFSPAISSITFPTQADRTFSLAYKINKSQISKGKRMIIYNGNVIQKGKSIDRHIFVNLKTTRMDDVEIVGNYSLKQKVEFTDSLLKKSSLIINDYKTTGTNYRYQDNKCNGEDCDVLKDIITVPVNESNKELLIINSEFVLDKETDYYAYNRTIADFASKFVKIQYRINGKIYSDEAKSVTPNNAADFMAFIVSKEIDKADIIQCIITIRDKKYIINLKK